MLAWFKSLRRRHVWVSLLLVLSFAPKAFCPGAGVFPSPQNQHFQIPIRPGIVDEVPRCGYATSKSLFIYSLFKKLHQQLTTSAQCAEGTVIPELVFTSHARRCSTAANQSSTP